LLLTRHFLLSSQGQTRGVEKRIFPGSLSILTVLRDNQMTMIDSGIDSKIVIQYVHSKCTLTCKARSYLIN
jgi:hypothetical protein